MEAVEVGEHSVAKVPHKTGEGCVWSAVFIIAVPCNYLPCIDINF